MMLIETTSKIFNNNIVFSLSNLGGHAHEELIYVPTCFYIQFLKKYIY